MQKARPAGLFAVCVSVEADLLRESAAFFSIRPGGNARRAVHPQQSHHKTRIS